MIYGNNFIRVIGYCIVEDWRGNIIYVYKWVLYWYIKEFFKFLVGVCIYIVVLDFVFLFFVLG